MLRSQFVVVAVLAVITTLASTWITSGSNVGYAQPAAPSRLTCVDFRGMSVTYVPDATIPDIAIASYAPNGAPIVRVHPGVLALVHPMTQTFFMAHECGHHVLAHSVRNIPLAQEQEADCFAIVQLVQQGIFDLHAISIVQNEISRFGRADWQHLPGPQRAINLQRCLQLASPTNSSSLNDSCEFAKDGVCDEPNVCASGTDATDCHRSQRQQPVRSRGDDSCRWANDGTCDEPDVCASGSDATDCAAPISSRQPPTTPRARGNSCEFAFDGTCDEPNLCAPGTDTADCNTRQVRIPEPHPPAIQLCQTVYGSCAMTVPGVPGGQCFCTTALGPVPGMISY
jgi:hypothetical protein